MSDEYYVGAVVKGRNLRANDKVVRFAGDHAQHVASSVYFNNSLYEDDDFTIVEVFKTRDELQAENEQLKALLAKAESQRDCMRADYDKLDLEVCALKEKYESNSGLALKAICEHHLIEFEHEGLSILSNGVQIFYSEFGPESADDIDL